MMAWKTTLKPDEMQAVSSYIVTLQGSNPPEAKAPQGTLYIPATVDSVSTKNDTLVVGQLNN